MRFQLTILCVLFILGAAFVPMEVVFADHCKGKHRKDPGCGGGGGGDEEEGPFVLVELSALDNEYSTAWDINENGQIAGHVYNDDGVAVAVIWTVDSDGSVSAAGLPGLPGGGSCGVQAINNLGDVVGYCIDAFGDFQALYWPAGGGSAEDLGVRFGLDISAYDINDAGQIVAIEHVPTPPGQQEPEPDRTHVLDLNSGQATLIEGGFVYGLGINSAGDVVGQSVGGPWPIMPRPLWWTEVNGAGTVQELGSPGDGGWARAINDAGQFIVGGGFYVDGSSHPSHPILWTVAAEGQVLSMEDLGTLGGSDGWASDVNDARQVVGDSLTRKGKRDSEHHHAFYWESGRFTQLNTPKRFSHKSNAVALNDFGFVVGNGYDANHRTKALLWVPSSN